MISKHLFHLSIRPQVLMVLIGASLAAQCWGQVVGASLSGTIRDASGAALPEALVTVRNLETGAARKLVSDEEGRYAAPSIVVGRYEVRAEKEGFSSQVKTGINLVVGQTSTVDLTLPVGEVKESVTVMEQPSPVTLSTQQTSGLVNERQVKELPLNGRSYDQLLTLNAGIVNYTSERSGGVGTSNSSVGNMFAISGHRPQENLFLLNGIEYTGASLINISPGGASGQLLGVEAVREFNVVSNTYGAQYGKRPGGQVSIVTVSGSNQLHGRCTSSCATATWTRAISSIKEASRNSSAMNSGLRSADRSKRTKHFSSATTRASGSTSG
jgi:carboxypeptidase family protein